ncbi:hypothetical protein DL96DRAFT_1552187 [Flagelloscypha sp. PMI_526]|nr:hypothetical protein DL96DRAFT_1552187 [Flagelloscypha sp. PMI_526]
MSSKRKWDDQGASDIPSTPSKAQKTDDSKSANEAAAQAAAIAAKIAAQFASGALGNGSLIGAKDPHDGEFVQDIDINEVRNRYMLTKGSTQEEIIQETGASISTKGTWFPDRSRATPDNPALYLHISATTKDSLQKAIDRINELISIELGSLVEEKGPRDRQKRKWPEEKLPVGLESIRNFNVRAKVVGPQGLFVKHIQQETQTRVQIKGIGSGFVDQETGRESDEPLYIHITGPEQGQVDRAKVLTEDLLLVVRQKHAEANSAAQQHQMELHQAQQQYAAYSGYAPPQAGQTAASAQYASPEAFAQYWAAYGYDVNSQQFKDWSAQQLAQYGPQAQAAAAAAAQPQQPAGAPPPPPPGAAPPPPPGEAPPPPPM